MTKRSTKERNQLGLELSSELNDLLETAVAEFGGSRPSNALEVLRLCLPMWIELKRQQKSEEVEQLKAALEIAMGKRPGQPPKTVNQDQEQGTVAPRRKRK